jgi:deoxyribonuclease-4
MRKLRLGVHTSIVGGISQSVERAVSLRCTTMQIFSHNPRQWKHYPLSEEEAERFKTLRHYHDITPVFIHASYLINLASFSNRLQKKSIKLLSYELMNADMLGAEYVVLHTGSAASSDEKKARMRAVRGIVKAVRAHEYRARLLLENTAGERGDITSSIATLADIINACRSEVIGGICIDTCHAFSSGYDVRTREGIEKLMVELKTSIGLDKLKLVHVNDSKRPLASRIDRHEHIGKGFIGTRGFKNILSDKRIANVPKILETPKKSENDDKANIRRIIRIIQRSPETKK